jgi:fatty-acid desaturase
VEKSHWFRNIIPQDVLFYEMGYITLILLYFILHYYTWGLISFMLLIHRILATVSFGSKELLTVVQVTCILITSCVDISLSLCGYTVLS